MKSLVTEALMIFVLTEISNVLLFIKSAYLSPRCAMVCNYQINFVKFYSGIMQYNVIFYFFYIWKILSLYSFRFLSRLQRLFRWERWECDILSRIYMSWVYIPLFVRRLRSSGSGLRRCEGLRRRHRWRLEYMRGYQLWGSRMFAIRMPVNWLISCWLKN